MTENAVHASSVASKTAQTAAPKEAGFGVRHRRGYVLSIAIGLVMAVIAPLQTDQIPFWPRLGYWQILMVSGATIGLGVTDIVERWGRLRRWPWIEVPLIGILIALPLTLIVMGAGAMSFGTTASGAFRFSYNFGVTAFISIAITALGHMIHTKDETPPTIVAAPAPTGAADTKRFADRLPLPLRSLQVIALEAEDHYLRVHLEGAQSTLILMRLSDAIAELPADMGAQTHRSWWVSKAAVRKVAKADGRATLTLDDDIVVPVSRSFYKALGEAGWFA